MREHGVNINLPASGWMESCPSCQTTFGLMCLQSRQDNTSPLTELSNQIKNLSRREAKSARRDQPTLIHAVLLSYTKQDFTREEVSELCMMTQVRTSELSIHTRWKLE